MPDFGSPVAQNVNAPNALQTLGTVLGLKQAQQNLQTGIYSQRIEKAKAQEQEQTAKQRAGIANVDWSKYNDGGGVISTDKMLDDPELRAAAGDQFLGVLQAAASARGTQIQNKQGLATLNATQLGQVGQVVGGLRTDPDVIADNEVGRQKVKDALTQFSEYSPDAKKMADIYLEQLDKAPKGHLVQGVATLQQQAADVARQMTAQSPSYMDTGATLQNINPAAAGGNLTGAPTIGKGIAPGMSTFADQAGNVWAFNPQNPGHAVMVGQGGNVGGGGGGLVQPNNSQGGAPSAQPSGQAAVNQHNTAAPQSTSANGSMNAPPILTVGEADQVKNNVGNVTATRQMAQDAQVQRDILNRISSIASSPNLYLGPGSQNVAQLATAVSNIPGMEGAKEYANNANELMKFMAQNAARMGKSMGLEGSDARLDLALHSQPNANMDAKTIQHVAQYMSGIVKMGLSKADAMDNWLKQPGNSLQNEHQFEKIWRDNADPRLFQMSEIKDQGEAQDYAKLHVRKSEVNSLNQKAQVLKSLGVQF